MDTATAHHLRLYTTAYQDYHVSLPTATYYYLQLHLLHTASYYFSYSAAAVAAAAAAAAAPLLKTAEAWCG